jgi:hypothetical protein
MALSRPGLSSCAACRGYPLTAHLLHQPRDRAPGDVEAFTAHLVPDFTCAVDAPVILGDTPDPGPQRPIPARMFRQSDRVGAPGQMITIGGRGRRQNVTDRLGPVRVPTRVDETHHDFERQSNSAIANRADAWRGSGSPAPAPSSSRQYRSGRPRAGRCRPRPSCPSRSGSAARGPSPPRSTSHPASTKGCWTSISRTSRTARSRT